MTAACAQVIGLGSYEKDEEPGEDAGDDAGRGGLGGSGGTAGTTSGRGGTGVAGVAQGGAGEGGQGGDGQGGDGQGGDGQGGSIPVAGEDGRGGSEGGTGGTSEGGASGRPGGGGSGGEAGGGTVQCVERELLVDGGMDGTLEDWFEYRDDEELAIGEPTGLTPDTPPYVAWLSGSLPVGEYLTFESEVSQSFVMPVGTTSLRARCVFQAYTEEVTLTRSYDFLHIILETFDEDLELFTRVNTFVTVSNLDATNTDVWMDLSGTVTPRGLDGIEAWFTVYSESDLTNITDFFVDSCSLVATVCN